MNGFWLRPDAVFDGQSLWEGADILLRDGKVVEIGVHAGAQPIAGIVTPGFFDLQVNGGGGVLFNTSPTREGAAGIAAAHAGLGTEACLVTVITDAPEVLDAAAAALIADALPDHVFGLHVEGPHISTTRKGTHDPDHIRPLDARTTEVLRRLRRNGVPVLITLAPEAIVSGQIAELVEMGVVVSLGHSDCSAEAAAAAFSEGAGLVTHLFNAMSQMQGRAPGLAGAALNSDVHVSIIADGIHVASQMVGLAFRARPLADRMILVSDAMPTVGGPDSFELYGRRITLANGRLVNALGGLAGAHLTMAEAVGHSITACGLRPETALRAAITNPARLMGLEAAFSLTAGARPWLLGRDWRMAPLGAVNPARA